MDSLIGIFLVLKAIFKRYYVHFISWSAFICWETVIIGLAYGQFGNFSNYVIHYAVNITIFYLHAYILKKSFENTKQAFWKTPLFLIAETIFFVGFIYGMDSLLLEYTNVFNRAVGPPFQRILTILWRCLYFMFFGTGYYFLLRFLNMKAEKERIDKQRFKILLDKEKTEKELALSKNAFLKAQISPHLLFNTLEFVYQKFKKHAPEDAQAMIYLSEMMRYAASTEHQGEYIKFAEEIKQCENLIRLHELTNPSTFITFAYAPDVEEIKFIPLVLITILENMFKHGDLTNPTNRASLDVFLENGYLMISCLNKINFSPIYSGLSSGLSNVKNRLDFAYSNSATLNFFNDDEGFFHLIIKVDCKIQQPKKILSPILA